MISTKKIKCFGTWSQYKIKLADFLVGKHLGCGEEEVDDQIVDTSVSTIEDGEVTATITVQNPRRGVYRQTLLFTETGE